MGEKTGSRVRLRKPDRLQVMMRMESGDELILQSHQARVIWSVVLNLDVSAFCEPIKARDGVCGRDSTDPALLISLWLYAATRGVGSARELARLCTESRGIVGVEVSNAGSDKGLAEPMREQVEERTGQDVQEHLIDGGFLVIDEIGRAVEDGVTLFVPPTRPRDPEKLDQRYLPKPSDSDEQAKWRARMGTEEAKAIYKERASTIETANADLKTHRGLTRLLVRGQAKIKCVVLWCALAYNLLHFGGAMIG